MTESWDRVTALFDTARLLDAAPREAFLALACGADDALREQVDALLAADGADDAFLRPPHWSDPIGPVAEALESGTLLKGRYRVGEALGTGAQALVYRAADELLSRSVVIKVMRAEGAGSRLLKSHFEREMTALALIEHPGVVGILDVGELADASPFLVIQYVHGTSLREAMIEGPLPLARVAAITAQMGSALHAAHVAGISHRDLKPENVMLQVMGDGGLSVKLIDFGVAKIDTDGLEPSTTMLLIAGTVRYMAPEQLEGRPAPASDIYSLALIVCEMLGGQPDLRALPKSVPRSVRAPLEAALAYHPEARPADVGEWSATLARRVRSRGWRTHRMAAGTALATLMVAGTLASQFVTRATREPERIIEKVGAFDPLTEGFSIAHDVTGRIVDNPTRTGYDAWRIISGSQGLYYRPFTANQKRHALERGWKLSAVFKVEEGAGGVGTDFSSAAGRFDVNVIRAGDHEIVRLMTQIVPDLRGLEIRQSPPGEYHTYELTYDPQLRTADLWIDGERRLTGYTGHRQFQEDRGLHFHSYAHIAPQGSAAFKSVRFEINP